MATLWERYKFSSDAADIPPEVEITDRAQRFGDLVDVGKVDTYIRFKAQTKSRFATRQSWEEYILDVFKKSYPGDMFEIDSWEKQTPKGVFYWYKVTLCIPEKLKRSRKRTKKLK